MSLWVAASKQEWSNAQGMTGIYTLHANGKELDFLLQLHPSRLDDTFNPLKLLDLAPMQIACVSLNDYHNLIEANKPVGVMTEQIIEGLYKGYCNQVKIATEAVDLLTQRTNRLADECQTLKDENTRLHAENSKLRRGMR